MSSVKELAPKIRAAIEGAQSILLHFHPSPDPDSVGGSLALMHAIQGMGKKVTVFKGDSDLPTEYSFFPGIDVVEMKSWHELNHSDYDLFIVQDATIDRVTRIVQMDPPQGMKMVVIDHHKSNPGGGAINLIDPSYAANCELIFDLFTEWGVEITPNIAHCLMIGIYTDTGGFRHDSTRPHTLAVAARLAEIYPAYTDSLAVLYNSHSKASVRFYGIAYSSISEYEGGLAISTVPYQMLVDNGIAENDTSSADVAQILKSALGWNVGVCAIEIVPGEIKTSFRTRDSDTYDLSVICGKIGGGGHRAAAGAFIKKPLDEAVHDIVRAFNEYRAEKEIK